MVLIFNLSGMLFVSLEIVFIVSAERRTGIIVSGSKTEYDQEISLSHTADQSTAQ